jgi:hypothetical protein
MWEVDDDLIYLYSSKKENKNNNERRYEREHTALNIRFKDLTFSELPTYMKKLVIPSKLQDKFISSIEVKPKNPRFDLQHINNLIIITVHVKNEYVESSFTLRYDLDDDEFYPLDFYHNYDRLEAMGWFKSEVERIKKEVNLEVDSYSFGFENDFNGAKLTIHNEFRVHVTFGDGDFLSKYPDYNVNFEKRKLEFYHMMQGHEMFAGIL